MHGVLRPLRPKKKIQNDVDFSIVWPCARRARLCAARTLPSGMCAKRCAEDAVMIAKDATFNVKKKGRAHCGVAFAVARRHHLTFQHYYGLKSDTQRSSSARV